MINYTLRQLEYLTAVADIGSAAGAAKQLHISESAVLLGLSELEAAVGEQLCIRRRSRGIQLTSEGARLTSRARRLLREAEALASAGPDGDIRGRWRLGAPAPIAPLALPPILESLGSVHPGLVVEIVVDEMDDLIARMRAGDLDASLLHAVRLTHELDFESLFSAPVQAVLPASHPLAAETRISLRALENDELILLDTPLAESNTLRLLASVGITPQVRFRTSNLELVRALVARGWGYSLLAIHPRANLSYEGRPLAVVPIEEAAPSDAIVLAWPRVPAPTPTTIAAVSAAAAAWASGAEPVAGRGAPSNPGT